MMNPLLKPFLGTWLLISSITDGRQASESDIQDVQVSISEATQTVSIRGQIIAHEVPFSVDFSMTPYQTTDFLPDGQQIKGISKVESDILTSCVAPIGQERPKKFESLPGTGITLREFRRLLE